MTNASPYKIEALRIELVCCAAEIARALLGQPNDQLSDKRQLRFGRKGSLVVVTAGPMAGKWFDHENGVGGDMFDLIRRQNGNGRFIEALQYAERYLRRGSIRPDPEKRAGLVKSVLSASNIQRACKLWQEAGPISGTVGERYLATRGILDVIADIKGAVLRFHPSCPFQETRQMCVLALMSDVVTNEPRAIQRTALTRKGQKIGRMTLGPKTGTAIKLSADEDVAMGLAVGEGLETVLSAMRLGFRPAWAVGDAGSLRRFPVLSGIECLTILVDNDENGVGQRSALECSRRWTSVGREVVRVVPEQPGYDINDVILRNTP